MRTAILAAFLIWFGYPIPAFNLQPYLMLWPLLTLAFLVAAIGSLRLF